MGLYIMHYGVGHDKGGHSGRYPWGSGKNPTYSKKIYGSVDTDTRLRDTFKFGAVGENANNDYRVLKAAKKYMKKTGKFITEDEMSYLKFKEKTRNDIAKLALLYSGANPGSMAFALLKRPEIERKVLNFINNPNLTERTIDNYKYLDKYIESII